MSSEHIPFSQAIALQPQGLREAGEVIVQALKTSRIEPWASNDSVAIVAMGASTNSGYALVAHLASVGIRGVSYTASDIYFSQPGFQPGDHCVIVSESGRSPEPLAVANSLPKGMRLVITNEDKSPLALIADVLIPLGGFKDSGVYTLGYTTTLLAYSLLAEAAGVPRAALDPDAIARIVDQLLVNLEIPAVHAAQHIHGARVIDVVGHGFSYASAAETALMIREGGRTPSAAFDTYQYVHGPMEAAGVDTAAIIFGDEREVNLIGDLLAAGTCIVHISSKPLSQYIDHAGYVHLLIPSSSNGFCRAITEIVAAQLVVQSIAELEGIPVGTFRYEQQDTKISLVV
jgi:fructoselysine-6-P-deglycase FrlB-like protein